MGLFTKVFGTYSERELKKLYPTVDKIEALEPSFQKLTDEELSHKTVEFKERIARGETLDSILPETFAAVREASWRVIGMKHFRVQLVGGIVLHQGRIAEMKTGEGKTLVATLPAYLNALTGKGVHIVTVNDYLAQLASEWMGKVYRFMGLSVGLIVHGLTSEQRKAAYEADITYGTNNEMGFDYLRDNMAIYKQNMVQRGHVFAIVDEVDSILIDEARTPLIISGTGAESSVLYKQADDFVKRLRKKVFATIDDKVEEGDDIDADYVVDEKARSATLTAKGIAKAEAVFGLNNYADLENSTLTHHINQALKAYGIMKRDVDYVVKDGSVVIVDEFTGRLMYGRRYSEGLHQAIEAKENINIAAESKTFATITFQNYFRLYTKLSGMTGTALTEEEEFGTIYSLDIIEIPTNKPMIRVDHTDAVYKNENGKNRAIIRQIQECHEKGQPVLVGTISIEKSEYLSALLKKIGIKHNVLNAKHHEKEAEIVAQAGRLGAVTISTNMAGRGTDILLGGNPETMAIADLKKAGIEPEIINEAIGYAETDNEDILNARKLFREKLEEHKQVTSKEAELVKKAGGLFVLGTERHESRRIDNQLRGRSGRQGDPGESRFMIAMTDDLMRLFGSDRMMNMMETLKVDEDMPIDQKILSNAIESAQKKVESRNFSIRKTVLSYDDVMNKQREIIYGQRMQVLNGENVQSSIASMLHDTISKTVSSGFAKGGKLHDISELDEILAPFKALFLTRRDAEALQAEISSLTPDSLTDKLYHISTGVYDRREEAFGNIPGTETPLMREIERIVMLGVVDEYWMDHIDAMQELRQGIGLRAYGQVDPLDEYKREGFEIFDAMVNGIREEVIRRIFTVAVQKDNPVKRMAAQGSTPAPKASDSSGGGGAKAPVKTTKKIGRNDPCPCGSGKKYKKCCGRFE